MRNTECDFLRFISMNGLPAKGPELTDLGFREGHNLCRIRLGE